MKTLNLAVVGLGHRGRHMVKCAKESFDNTKILAACDIHPVLWYETRNLKLQPAKKEGLMCRNILLSLCLLAGGILIAAELPEPVFETTFQTLADGKIQNNYPEPASGNMNPAGTSIIDAPFGKAMKLDGQLNNGIVFPSSTKLLLPEEFTVAGWIYLEEFPSQESERPYRTFTFFHREDKHRIFIRDHISTEFAADGELFRVQTPKNTLSLHAWTHIAYTYSVSQKKLQLFINGKKLAERGNSVLGQKKAPFAYPVDKPLSFGSLRNYFPMKGMLGRLRIYNQTLNAEQINLAEQDITRDLLAALRDELKNYSEGANRSAAIDRLLEKPDEVIPLASLYGFYAERNRLQQLDALLKSGEAANTPLLYAVVDPTGPDLFYRETELPDGKSTRTLLIAAAQNEYEPASFVVKPLRNLTGFLPVMEDLISAQGDRIPASAVDIRLLKQIVIYGRTLSPNVLIHDDALLKVDPVNMEMHLRLSFPEGNRYVNMTPETPEPCPRKTQTAKNYPVVDAAELQPADLQGGANQQYWLTLSTNSGMKPGLYTSKVNLTENGVTLASIPLKVRILPFTLPEPKTNYDPDREFSTSVYFFDDIASGCSTSEDGAINHVMPLSRQQFQAYLKNLYEHGIRHPTIIMGNWFPGWNPWIKPQAPRSHDHPEILQQQMIERIQLLKEAGFSLNPLYLHTGGNLGFREFYQRDQHLPLLEQFIREGHEFYKRILGHDNIYHYGLDEAEGERLLKEFPVWEDMRKRGAKIYTTLKAANIPLVAGKLDIAVAVHKPDKANAKLLHDNGGQLWVYAQPFARPAHAYLHRRGYGYGVYFADYDGICNYSFNHWDWRTIPWNMHNRASASLAYTMPAANGVIDSPGWEGYREGIDDIRYATKLRQEIRRAADLPAKREIAARALHFLDTVNIDTPEFSAAWTRMRIIDFILDLVEE